MTIINPSMKAAYEANKNQRNLCAATQNSDFQKSVFCSTYDPKTEDSEKKSRSLEEKLAIGGTCVGLAASMVSLGVATKGLVDSFCSDDEVSEPTDADVTQQAADKLEDAMDAAEDSRDFTQVNSQATAAKGKVQANNAKIANADKFISENNKQIATAQDYIDNGSAADLKAAEGTKNETIGKAEQTKSNAVAPYEQGIKDCDAIINNPESTKEQIASAKEQKAGYETKIKEAENNFKTAKAEAEKTFEVSKQQIEDEVVKQETKISGLKTENAELAERKEAIRSSNIELSEQVAKAEKMLAERGQTVGTANTGSTAVGQAKAVQAAKTEAKVETKTTEKTEAKENTEVAEQTTAETVKASTGFVAPKVQLKAYQYQQYTNYGHTSLAS